MNVLAFRYLRSVIAAALAAAGLWGAPATSASGAVVGNWNVNASGVWSNSGNWLGGVIPNGAGDTANFTIDVSGVRNIDIDTTSRTVGIMNWGDTNTSNSYTMSASGGASLIFDNGVSNAQLNQTALSHQNTISAPILLNSSLDINNASTTGKFLQFTGGLSAGTAGLKTITNASSGNGSFLANSIISDGLGQVALVQRSTTTAWTPGTNSNSFSGGVTLSRGTIAASGFNQLTSNANKDVTFGDASTAGANLKLTMNGNFLLRNVNVTSNATGTNTLEIASSGGTVSIASIQLANALTLGRTAGGLADTQMTATTNVITGGTTAGTDALIISLVGGGTTRSSLTAGTASNAINFTGNVRITGSGTWQMQNLSYVNNIAANQNLWIPDTSSVTVDAGTTWAITHGVETIDGLNGGGTVRNVNGTNYLAGTATLTVGAGNGNGNFSGLIQNNAVFSLAKTGTGTQILSGATNTYSGGTTINGGTLAANAAQTLGTGGVVVNNTGTLTTGATNALTGSQALTINSGGTAVLGSANNHSGATTISGGTLRLQDTAAVASSALNLSTGTLQLRGDSSTNFSAASVSLGSFSGSYTVNVAPLTSASNQTLGFATATLVQNVTALNVTGGNGYTFSIGTARFGNSNPSFNPTTANLAITQLLHLTQANGELNNSTARTAILGGAATGNTLGTLENQSGQTGTLSLTKQGTGVWTITGANSYTGTTTINGGVLRVNGAHTNAGAYNVNSTGTLGGTGSITTNNANVTVNSGGFLSPGASTGTLTMSLGSGTLNLSAISNGALVFEIGAIGASDQVDLNSGTLNIGTLNFNEFNFLAVSGIQLGTYKLFDSVNPVTGLIGTASGLFNSGKWGGYIWLDNNSDVMLTLDFTTVPEPNTLILAAIGMVGLYWRVRRRRG